MNISPLTKGDFSTHFLLVQNDSTREEPEQIKQNY
jgi:hypothetical protein